MMNTKEVKMMTWCPNRITNFFDTCARTVGLLFPLCDVLASCDVKQEERTYFMSPLCLDILHLLADLQGVKISDYLRKLDTDDAVIMDVFGLSKKICTRHTRVEDFMVFKKFGLVIFNMNLNQDI